MATSPNDSKPIRVRLAPVGSIDIYQVKDSELEILEKGGPAATHLNFAVFAFSLAFSALGTLLTANFESDIAETFYVVAVVGGLLMGAYCLVQWKQSSTSVRTVVEGIRSRMNQDTVDSQSVPPAQPPSPPTPPLPIDSPQ